MKITEKDQQSQKNIGWDGKTLRQMRQEVDELSSSTGHYAGLRTLPLKETDPIRYEKIFSKLRRRGCSCERNR